MDIVVTIPREHQAAIEAEERELEAQLAAGVEGADKLRYFWCLGRRPAKLEPGDRMYFLWDCAVRAWHEVIGFDDDLMCEHSGAVYAGTCVILHPMIHRLDHIIIMEPFRGFRYWKSVFHATKRFRALSLKYRATGRPV